jgi:hypothetical protein
MNSKNSNLKQYLYVLAPRLRNRWLQALTLDCTVHRSLLPTRSPDHIQTYTLFKTALKQEKNEAFIGNNLKTSKKCNSQGS